MADALQSDGVLGGKAVALDVAGDVQAGDDIAVGVEGVAVLVALEASDADQQQSSGELVGVEGAVFDCPHTGSGLVEVLIVTGLGQLVVALDGVQSGLLGGSIVRVDLCHQLFQRVGLHSTAIGHSMKNKELLKMLSLEKGLVYFTTSLKSNELVMEKTLKGKIIKLYDEDEDILEDAIIENRQAIEMAKIYSDILNGTMEAYASIISNNLNTVMKTLTSITIVLAVPTMISSFWGMNVQIPFQNNPFGFVIMIFVSVVLTLLVTWLLKKKDMLN